MSIPIKCAACTRVDGSRVCAGFDARGKALESQVVRVYETRRSGHLLCQFCNWLLRVGFIQERSGVAP